MSVLDLKYYVLDWDDNILFMPTLIHLQKDGKPVDVATKDYAEIRHDKSYQLLDDDPDKAFAGFRDGTGDFVADIRKALATKEFAPSFLAFKRALRKARLFCIVTARGHSSETIRRGVELFIEEVFSDEEREEMLENIQTFNRLAELDIPKEACLSRYLDLNGYVGVSSPSFLKVLEDHSALEIDAADAQAHNPENAKTFAVRRFVQQTLKLSENLPAETKNIAFGFSDDDLRNLATMREFLKKGLAKEFPHVDFFVYDTSGENAEVEQL
ncbi:MAG: hypothetical protein ACI9EW_000534 [Cellvibrionaceae bacterium]|jgi:hypothetical protein